MSTPITKDGPDGYWDDAMPDEDDYGYESDGTDVFQERWDREREAYLRGDL